MKKCISIVFLLSLYLTSYAQDSVEQIRNIDSIAISDIKTTHIIFKDPIDYLDIGSQFFISDTIGKMIKVKHVGSGYTSRELGQANTNMTVITGGGDFYSIPLYYKREIKTSSYKFGVSENNFDIQDGNYKGRSKQDDMDDIEMEALYNMCNLSSKAENNINLKGNRDLILARIKGVYYQGDYIAMKLIVKNFSTIDLDIDQFLFRFMKRKRVAKNSLYQERQLVPLRICNKNRKLKGQGGVEVYNFIFKKFFANVDEDLQLDILEEGGGRSTTIEIPRKKLVKPGVF